MAASVLLVTQVGQDFVNVPASQNIWLAGMAEGLSDLGMSVHIPWKLSEANSRPDLELSQVAKRFTELYGVGGPALSFFDSRELNGPSLPSRFDAVWTRDPNLLSKRVSESQVIIAEYHGGSKERMIPELSHDVGAPLVTVTKGWAQQFNARCVAEPGALKVFFNELRPAKTSGRDHYHGVYAGGLDPDRIDGVGILALRQLLQASSAIHVIGGNLGVEIDILRWRLRRYGRRAKFYGYLPPTITARLLHSSDFAVALKAEHSAPSAPIKLISFAAARLPILVSRAFSKPDYSGETARKLRVTKFKAGVNPGAAESLQRALTTAPSDISHNFRMALDNTYSKRIEKTGLLGLFS